MKSCSQPGEIYSAKDVKTDDLVAVKVERVSKPGNLVHEEEILRALQGSNVMFVLTVSVQVGSPYITHRSSRRDYKLHCYGAFR